jgi:hypothetical protein
MLGDTHPECLRVPEPVAPSTQISPAHDFRPPDHSRDSELEKRTFYLPTRYRYSLDILLVRATLGFHYSCQTAPYTLLAWCRRYKPEPLWDFAAHTYLAQALQVRATIGDSLRIPIFH